MTIWLRRTIWFSRGLLLVASVLFLAIAVRNIVDPAAAEGPVGIVFNSAGGVTVGRVGFGAFPLGFAIVLVACLISERRLLTGLWFLNTLVVVLTAVRILGLVVDGPAAFNLKVLRPEIALVVLSTVAVQLEGRRRARATRAS
ncbi:MAG TPA: hypothetical protein VKQ32_03690 [Polyangia bacterium]|nr:hypothetical protein [Polyangia bacterium]